jgi:ParB/RepB/Spo0J family partition protein
MTTSTTSATIPKLQPIALADLAESPTNPRKKFNEAELAELTESVRAKGVKQPLLVRPRWCVGVQTDVELAALMSMIVSASNGNQDMPFEIIAGARRYRAATRAELLEVPCIVEYLTDAEAFDLQLIENLQRVDLTPIEEAEGYQDALELKIEGKPVNTVDSLAARLNKAVAHIYERLLLVRLPKFMREAVEAGALPVSTAARVARVPDAELRSQAGRTVLDGHGKGSALSFAEAVDLLQREYMRELKGAPFDQADALLLPGAGSCATCPLRSGNIAGFEGKRGDICTSPGCYTRKADAAFARITAQAEKEGKRVLPAAEAARHFDALGELQFTTTLVRLSTKPEGHLLKADVNRAPTWAALRELAIEKGLDVPVLVARNPKTGLVEELIDRAPLVAASKKIGEPIFRGGKEDEPLFPPKKAGEDDDDAFKRGQREVAERAQEESAKSAAQATLRQIEGADALKRIFAALHRSLGCPPTGSLRSSLLGELVPEFVHAAGPHGQRLFVKAFDLKPGKGVFGHADAIEVYVKAQPMAAREPLCWLLLLAPGAAEEGASAAGLLAMARALVVDLSAPAPTKNKKRLATKSAKGAKQKPKGSAAKAVAAIKGSLKKRGVK